MIRIPYSDSTNAESAQDVPLQSKRATDEEEAMIGRQCGSRRVFVRNTLIEEIDLLDRVKKGREANEVNNLKNRTLRTANKKVKLSLVSNHVSKREFLKHHVWEYEESW
ncbi:hypothetical protein WN51_10848 [Melipona quadrifasciata]|uniref:Uncharacterized protein n=1 Tax=Melipona quadrifasciata TaxID=166423 RepID=A0A0N0BI64_9HYME|nr:hypothetical protein WN51_10848 [Melipona quadrifasciata]